MTSFGGSCLVVDLAAHKSLLHGGVFSIYTQHLKWLNIWQPYDAIVRTILTVTSH